jgi:cytochrome P450
MLVRDPRAVYLGLRTEAPAQQVVMPDGVPGWLVTNHAEAKLLLDDRRLSKDHRRAIEIPDNPAGVYALPLANHMLNLDPPDHTRLRKLVSKAFTARAVSRLRPVIEQIADDLLNAMAQALTPPTPAPPASPTDSTLPASNPTVPAPNPTAPPVDSPLPAPDPTTITLAAQTSNLAPPTRDLTVPVADPTAPAPDPTVSAADLAVPAPDPVVPSIDPAVPAPDLAAAARDPAVPAPDLAAPATDLAVPALDPTASASDLTAPAIDLSAAQADPAAPATDPTAPAIDSTAPASDLAVAASDPTAPATDPAAGAAEHATVDLLDALAFPLPIAVISELLGVPHADRERLRAWSKAFTSGVPIDVLINASDEVSHYLADLVAAKRAQPTDDLLSDLVQVTDEGDRLSENELVSMALLLIVAGHETTVNLIANSVLALLRHPDQLAALRADPSLMPGAVEEFLRYDGPIHIATLRFTTEPVPVGDVTIPAGEFVMISLLAANRDGERFSDPDRLDITRPVGGHLAFGHGIHYCVGAPLARLEAQITLSRLLARFDTLTLAGDPTELVWRGSLLIHGLRNLPVRLG